MHMSIAEGCWPADKFVLHGSLIKGNKSLLEYWFILVAFIAVIAILWAAKGYLQHLTSRFRRKTKKSIRLYENVIELTEDT
jgi:hypothetical protein